MAPAFQIALTFFTLLTTTFSHGTTQPSWRSLAPIPLPRQEHTAVFLPPNTVAVLGGIVPVNSTGTAVPFTTTSLVQFYSIQDNTWITAPPIPRAVNHVNVAVVNGKIYVLGGLADLGEETTWRGVGDSFVYCPEKGTWETLPAMRTEEARGSAAVDVYGSLIVLAGGITDLELAGNLTHNTVADVSIFDTKTRRWLDLPQAASRIPAARDHAGGAVVDGKMYVLGGRDRGQDNVRDTVFVLDLKNLSLGWKTSSALMPTPRGGVSTGVVGRKVYVFGGEGNKKVESGVFDQVEVYDTVRDRWENAGRMKLPRHGTYAVSVGEKIYLPGGGVLQGGAPVADFDVFEL